MQQIVSNCPNAMYVSPAGRWFHIRGGLSQEEPPLLCRMPTVAVVSSMDVMRVVEPGRSKVDTVNNRKCNFGLASTQSKQGPSSKGQPMSRISEQKENPLFDFVLLIKLVNEKGTLTPTVDYHFPPSEKDNKSDLAKSIAIFCFPELEVWEQTINKRINNKIQGERSETFNFVLTEGDGTKKFGYCRRYVIDNAPECFCILSFLPCTGLFLELLNAVEAQRKRGKSSAFSFLKTVLAKPFPAPGATVEVKTFDGPTYKITRSDNNFLLDMISYRKLFSRLSLKTILNLFTAVLTESRIIIIAESVSTLSSCVSALTGLVYPFLWQHVYIPILPKALLTYTCAPMPFLVGVLNCNQKELMTLPIEDGVMLDVDSGKLLRPLPDTCEYLKILPKKMYRSLFYLLTEEMNSYAEKQKTDMTPEQVAAADKKFDLNVSKIFLGFFVQVLGDYQTFMVGHKFDHERYKKSKGPELQKLFEMFGETQLYHMFIQEREDMSKMGKLNLCALYKPFGKYTWLEDNEQAEIEGQTDEALMPSAACTICDLDTGSTGIMRKGKLYCTECHSMAKGGKRNSTFQFKGLSMAKDKWKLIRASMASNGEDQDSSPKKERKQSAESPNKKDPKPDPIRAEKKEKKDKSATLDASSPEKEKKKNLMGKAESMFGKAFKSKRGTMDDERGEKVEKGNWNSRPSSIRLSGEIPDETTPPKRAVLGNYRSSAALLTTKTDEPPKVPARPSSPLKEEPGKPPSTPSKLNLSSNSREESPKNNFSLSSSNGNIVKSTTSFGRDEPKKNTSVTKSPTVSPARDFRGASSLSKASTVASVTSSNDEPKEAKIDRGNTNNLRKMFENK
ncbi:suppression of tumorigenicity 5 [Planoprotostelium fungivorum]|uniref:Suppression of tumorigenicity 5 n=1 Tax=Planoprotostelium fungivorum TaxID=1890364 RepID=A0A2P6NCY8_9EUKA|nr:suppression of tumorigenicity 5 [Planoprotostelium fungivorum]